MSGLLSKYRVLDIAEETGILCGRFLGDFGAEVIKIEGPGGHPARNKPPFKFRHHFQFLEHKDIGRHAYHAPSYRLSKAPPHVWKAAPCLGEDNEYVYKEILGLSDDEIADLLVEGVITTEADAETIRSVR